MEKRECRYCKKEYPIECFETANILKGKRYRRWKCRECKMEQQKKRRKDIREWFCEIKKTLKCEQCGEDDFRVLDFHHEGNEKKEFSMGDAIGRGYSKDKILSEIKKCKVLCCKCHRILHWEE
jgi:hypothetical protein